MRMPSPPVAVRALRRQPEIRGGAEAVLAHPAAELDRGRVGPRAARAPTARRGTAAGHGTARRAAARHARHAARHGAARLGAPPALQGAPMLPHDGSGLRCLVGPLQRTRPHASARPCLARAPGGGGGGGAPRTSACGRWEAKRPAGSQSVRSWGGDYRSARGAVGR
jgi:hypothetical protein